MRLVRLIYASKLNLDTPAEELDNIQPHAQKSNKERAITGILLFGSDYFLQALEGSRETVNKLYSKISVDPRHTDIIILAYEEISERVFERWAMKMILLTEARANLIQKFSITGNFDPFNMSGSSALKLMTALAAPVLTRGVRDTPS